MKTKYDWLGVNWNLAPSWALYWVYCNINKSGYWCKKKPIKLNRGWCTSTLEVKSPDFNYQGNWQNSLEERPNE